MKNVWVLRNTGLYGILHKYHKKISYLLAVKMIENKTENEKKNTYMIHRHQNNSGKIKNRTQLFVEGLLSNYERQTLKIHDGFKELQKIFHLSCFRTF